jgi:hypothetical protein
MLLWVLGGILAFDAVMVVVFAVFAAVARVRAPRHRGAHQDPLQLETLDRARVGSRPRLLLRRGGGEGVGAPQDDRRRSIHLVRSTDAPTPQRHRRPPRRRILAPALAAAVLFAGTAIASPDVRHVVATAFDAVTGGLGSATGIQDDQGAGADVDTSQPGTGPSASPTGDGTAAGTSTDPAAGSDPVTDASPPASSPDIVTAPRSPTIVTAVPGASGSIDLAWTDVAGETGYRIERSADGADGWTTAGTTAQDATIFGDTGLASGTTYYYRITATNGDGDSTPSDVASATTIIDPASPTTLLVVPGSSTDIILTWTDVADETGYRVERSADGANGWVTITTTGQDVTTYDDAGLTPGTTYSYRIFATNAGGDSPPSDVASATTMLPVGGDPSEGVPTP